MNKSIYFGNHIALEIDTTMFSVGIVLGLGYRFFTIELGFIGIKFY